jgi:glutaredoxin 3
MDFLSRTIRPILNSFPNPFAMASTSSTVTTHPAMDLVEKTIDENFVTVFSKSYCPYCRRAKGLINDLNLAEGKTVKIYECVSQSSRA